MLKISGVKLEKVSDIDQYLFIENGTRGGISYIAKRYAKANNKYMSDYDSNKQSTFITYLDKNNLYGWSMSKYLPYGEFKWLKNVDELDIMSINKKSDVGYEQIIEMGRNNDYRTGNLLDYEYFSRHYKLIAIGLSKQIELENLDLTQQINFNGRIERNEGATMLFIIEKSEKTTFKFSQNAGTFV